MNVHGKKKLKKAIEGKKKQKQELHTFKRMNVSEYETSVKSFEDSIVSINYDDSISQASDKNVSRN